jgi:hypothetical protein
MGEVRYLFADMNSFFAAVEQQERPGLRGLPVVVAPTLVETTCCIVATYEAKGYGIKTGTPIHEARKRCPHLELVEARPQLYVQYHHRVVEAVESCLQVDQNNNASERPCVPMAFAGRPRSSVNLSVPGSSPARGAFRQYRARCWLIFCAAASSARTRISRCGKGFCARGPTGRGTPGLRLLNAHAPIRANLARSLRLSPPRAGAI